jgi:arylsulfatase A-like enzyme
MALLQYETMTEKDHRIARSAYWAMCDLIDEQVGRILGTLDESGLRNRTIVIFMSDHGEMLGDHGIYLKGPFFYEPAVHVPLIISCPGLIDPGRSRALVELTDLAQTLLDAVGLPHHPGMQGESLWPLLMGETARDHHRDDIYCEYYNALTTHKDPKAYGTMVRTDRYKLVVAHGQNTGELYDLANDPDETDNEWENPEYLKTKTELLTRMMDRMAWTVDPLPLREAPW